MKKALENMVGKGENAGYQHFCPFPTVFSALSERKIVIFNLPSVNAFNLVKSEISSFGNGLNLAVGVDFFHCLVKEIHYFNETDCIYFCIHVI